MKTSATARPIITAKIFTDPGDWAALRAAEAWMASAGFSIGSMQAAEPMGVLRGDYLIAKWRNLSAAERAGLDGVLEGSKRHGPVTVSLYVEVAR